MRTRSSDEILGEMIADDVQLYWTGRNALGKVLFLPLLCFPAVIALIRLADRFSGWLLKVTKKRV